MGVPDPTRELREESVLANVDRCFPDDVEFLRSMVRCPSLLGHERDAQQVVFDRLKALGFTAEMWDVDVEALRRHPSYAPLDVSYAGRPNVTAVWKAAAPGGHSLILNGHIDVVSAEPHANWTHDPYGAAIEGDWLYGRGSADMKAGIAAMILAAGAVRAAGVQLRGDLILESVIEEEASGNGTLACCLRGLRAEAGICTEPMQAYVAHVGPFWFRVRTRGVAAHPNDAKAGVNAIESMVVIIAALRRLEASINDDVRHPLFRSTPHPINLTIGRIQAGSWPSMVPSECTLECRLAAEPGVTIPQSHERVRAAIHEAAQLDPWLRTHPPEVEFFGLHAAPSVTDPSGPSMRALGECHRAVTGAPLTQQPFFGATDQRYFINDFGMEATSYGPLGEGLHAVEERVSLASMRQVAKVLALYIMRWCGVAE